MWYIWDCLYENFSESMACKLKIKPITLTATTYAQAASLPVTVLVTESHPILVQPIRWANTWCLCFNL